MNDPDPVRTGRGWRDTRLELPPLDVDVVVHAPENPDRVTIAHLGDDGRWWEIEAYPRGGHVLGPVTHWQPFPDAPEQ